MHCLKCQSEQVVKTAKSLFRIAPMSRSICVKPAVDNLMNAPGHQWQYAPDRRLGINVRTEGLGVRAAGRDCGKSHSTIIRWEKRLADSIQQWSPSGPSGSDVTLEGDEVYTRCAVNLPQGIWSLDYPFDWTGNATGLRLKQDKTEQIIWARDSKCLGVGKASWIYSVARRWRTPLRDLVLETCQCSPQSGWGWSGLRAP
jgi:hypothetical protein